MALSLKEVIFSSWLRRREKNSTFDKGAEVDFKDEMIFLTFSSALSSRSSKAMRTLEMSYLVRRDWKFLLKSKSSVGLARDASTCEVAPLLLRSIQTRMSSPFNVNFDIEKIYIY